MLEEYIKNKKDLICGLTVMAFTLIGTWGIVTDDFLMEEDYGADPGPSLVPIMLLCVLGLLGIHMTTKACYYILKNSNRVTKIPSITENWITFLIPLTFVCTMFFYTWIIEIIGFIWVTLGFTLLWIFTIGIHDNGQPTKKDILLYFVYSVAMTFFIYYIFVHLIMVQLP
ncbi:MAG: tripartite tricarboxylate transporter TctB family protein [Candidatus Marinimicrobia bacterium]|nr:tripartite tricarboxylate transporter TctB family protein [Candidatus Neomarinimicrobiota bacterium]